MMASITRCCVKPSRAAVLAVLWLVMGCLFAAGATQANGIDVRKAALTASDEGYVLEAEFDIQLTPLLGDVLHKGVPLYFLLEFELIRARWYWTNEKVVTLKQLQRLSFNTLTRQYRVGAGALYQNFPSLAEALAFMSRVRRREDMDAGLLRKDTSYAAALRMRLDTTQLPKPFQLNTGRDWDIGSDWYRWTVTP